MDDRLKIALIGQGLRGGSLRNAFFKKCKEVNILYVCDAYADRAEEGARIIREAKGDNPKAVTDYKEVLADPEVELVFIYTAWETHIRIAIDSMKAGKKTAMEVGGACSVHECWQLVRTQEETGVQLMFMENCCFDRSEVMALKMARAGVFGDIVHCSGAYSHDLRSEVTEGNRIRHYRLRHYTKRNAENYPTHELGPIAKILDVNRGNRLVSLVSVASKSMGLKRYIKEKGDEADPLLKDQEFNQGDIVDTIITCANGETIHLKLDTTLPGFYNRDITIRGTMGSYYMSFNGAITEGKEVHTFDPVVYIQNNINSANSFEHLLPPEWSQITEEQKSEGHGGMDGIMLRRIIHCAKTGEEFPLDVYDAAAWMVITPLSEQSIAMGGAPQAIPDFTSGEWVRRPRKDVF